jgi:hypothetical protein
VNHYIFLEESLILNYLNVNHLLFL